LFHFSSRFRDTEYTVSLKKVLQIDMYKSDASEGALLPAAPLRFSLSVRICPPHPRIRE